MSKGLEKLSESFPWVAGQVVNEGSNEGNTGVFKIKPSEKTPPLVVKDLREDPLIPSIEALRRANFPFSMLDESLIAPRHTLAGFNTGSDSASPAVFLIQATFITGGLLLTFVAQYNVMDMTGQGQVMELLAKACRDEAFTSEELRIGNFDRRNIIPLLEEAYKPGPELARQIVRPSPTQPLSETAQESAAAPPPMSTWAYFTFSPT